MPLQTVPNRRCVVIQYQLCPLEHAPNVDARTDDDPGRIARDVRP